MATTKNITMKQFNGTDYDTLYPKTKVEQIENLTPSSIGAVNKSGGVMTGELAIRMDGVDTSFLNSAEALIIRSVESGGWDSRRTLQIKTKTAQPDFNKSLTYSRSDDGWLEYVLLHTGNAQSLGFTKIATGSYIGTGTYGSINPNTLTFDFEPKIVFLSVDSSSSVFEMTGFMFFIRNQSGSPSWYYYNSDYVGRAITWSGNTLSWYTLAGKPNVAPDSQQFNASGTRYCYVALG